MFQKKWVSDLHKTACQEMQTGTSDFHNASMWMKEIRAWLALAHLRCVKLPND